MGLRIRDGINLEILKCYGFKKGKEYAAAKERCLDGIGYEYQHEWWHKFLMDEEDPEHIAYTSDEYAIPMVQISIRTGDPFNNDLYVDCAPSYTYHIGGHELNIVLETIYSLTKDGILEKYES